MPLLLLFIIIPIVEIFLFMEIGGWIGSGWTILAVLATAFIGTALVRKQGLQALTRAKENLAQNRLLVAEVFTGICLLVAGLLLLTPGFLTDTIGFMLLVPLLRKSLGATLWHWIGKNVPLYRQQWPFKQNAGFNHQSPFDQAHHPGDVIDGEFEEVDSGKDSTGTPKKIDTAGPTDKDHHKSS